MGNCGIKVPKLKHDRLPIILSEINTVTPQIVSYVLSISIYVTEPAKTGHVGTNHILSHYRSYLSIGTTYLHSATCIIKRQIKCLLLLENCIAIDLAISYV